MDLKYFFDRATVREYSSQDIENDKLNEMIEAASHAPTTGGMQLYSVVMTRDKAIKEKLAPCHFGQPMVTSAPAVLTFCADFRRFGVASLEMCYLAVGRVDLYFEIRLYPWDFAASAVIIREAGGVINTVRWGNGKADGLIRPA